MSVTQAEIQETTLIIIGAGFSGVCMAIKLKEAGIDDFVILEANPGVGGTWRDNTYPGCACDVPSHLYSFSFAPRAEWSRKYGPQPEILDYIEECVERFALRPHLRLGVTVTEATYDATRGRWEATASDGRRFTARFLITGVGALRVPSIPTIPGIERFTGPAFHSARWDHSVDLRGKRVAVVGTGASAIQFVPAIAPEVAKLYLFQRTPPWIMPKPDRRFTAAELALFRRLPAAERLYRGALYWKQEAPAIGFIRFPKLLGLAKTIARRQIRQAIADPELRAKVTPNYAIGCKRILISNDYYPALARDNVEVITSGLRELGPAEAQTGDGETLAIDALIYGTGFKVTEMLTPMRIFGVGGRELSERWQAGAEAYLGTAVHGFPNLFMITGPNTGLGHSSMIFMIEAHVQLIRGIIQRVLGRDLQTVEVRPESERSYNRWIQRRMQRTVWTSGCASWYLDAEGRNFTLWPGFTWGFWLRTRRPRVADFTWS